MAELGCLASTPLQREEDHHDQLETLDERHTLFRGRCLWRAKHQRMDYFSIVSPSEISCNFYRANVVHVDDL